MNNSILDPLKMNAVLSNRRMKTAQKWSNNRANKT